MSAFSRVLVANRGEIAVRVLATLRRLGIVGIAVASPGDRGAAHVAVADVTVYLNDDSPAGSYLSVDAIVDAARRSGAEAIHPGYGFLSESPWFAQACVDNGITFIGPPVDAIATMGDKISAKAAVEAAGVPVVPGVHRPGMANQEFLAEAERIGYPLLVKAAAGGGGKGMRVVTDASDLPDALAAARREASRAFGGDELLLERFIGRPRHVEIQILADAHGTVWALTERECSLQRRYQKVVEESPSPVLHRTTRARMTAAATAAARSCGYRGAGTLEFLVPGATAAEPDAAFYFLEMNTRLQVEHPVTEAIHGVDLVEWQVRIAGGERLPVAAPTAAGHAIEARVYAEDPARGFLPTPGTVQVYAEPAIGGVRVDSGVRRGSIVSSDYDPLLAKVIAHAGNRSAALDLLRAGLRGYVTLGVATNSAFLQALLAWDDVRAGTFDTALIEREIDALTRAADDSVPRAAVPVVAVMAWLGRAERPPPSACRCAPVSPPDRPAARRYPMGWRLTGRAPSIVHQVIEGAHHRVVVDGDTAAAVVSVDEGSPVAASASWRDHERFAVTIEGVETEWHVAHDGAVWTVGRHGRMWIVAEAAGAGADADAAPAIGAHTVTAPMPGLVAVVDVNVGDRVRAGQRLMVVEAMKMEHPVVAGADGVVQRLEVGDGSRVAMGQPLAVIAAPDEREQDGQEQDEREHGDHGDGAGA